MNLIDLRGNQIKSEVGDDLVCDMGIISCSWLVAIAITSFHIEDLASHMLYEAAKKTWTCGWEKKAKREEGGRRGEHGRKRQKKKKRSDSLVFGKPEETERRLYSLLQGGRCCERRLVEEEI